MIPHTLVLKPGLEPVNIWLVRRGVKHAMGWPTLPAAARTAG